MIRLDRAGKRWIQALRVVVPVAALLVQGCGKSTPPPPPVVEVSVAKPVEKTVTEWDEFTGRLEPIKAVDVRCRVSGYLISIHFRDGQMVKVGDLLFVIDPRPYQAELDRTRAVLKKDLAARDLAKLNLQRAQKLIEGKTIAAEQFDQRKNEYDIADAVVGESEAAVKAAELNLEFTQVKAPIDGRVSKRYVDEGNFINGGSEQSTLLTTIVPDNPLYATFDVDERTVLKYTRLNLSGQRKSSREVANPVRLALSDEKKFSHDGTMDFVDNRLDPNTGTLRARALIDNADGLLTPGLFVRVQLKGRGPFKTLLIPDEAIGNDQSKKFVMIVVQGDVVKRRFVEIGRLYDGLREITSGLAPSDRVIIGGALKARPDAVVKPNLIEIAPGVDATDNS